MKNSIIASVIFLSCFWAFYFIFQNPTIYKYTLNKVSRNWVKTDKGRKMADTAYIQLTAENFLQWDGKHYAFIKDNGYNISKSGGNHTFAFFPLFPLLWKISRLPDQGIIFLNFILFSIGLILLQTVFIPHKNSLALAFVPLLFPGIVSFLIPYTEAVFFITLSIGIYGYMKDKYWLYLIGMMLASMARPSITLIALAVLCTELYYFIQQKNVIDSLKSFTKKISPLIAGTLIVSLIQLAYGSGSLTKFAEVQSLWGKKLSIPHNIRDWSLEGFSMNIAVIVFIAIPVLAFLFLSALKIFEKKNEQQENKVQYLQILSSFFIGGTFLYILLYQEGSLNGLFRYVQCTPFFFVLIFSLPYKLDALKNEYKIFMLFICFILGLFLLGMIGYSSFWSFADLGFFIFSSALFLWLFQPYEKNIYYKVLLVITLAINIIWTTYLFNMYISNGWIYT